MGNTGRYSNPRKRGSLARIARGTPWHDPDEVFVPNVCLVARHYRRHREVCTSLSPVPRDAVSTTGRTTESLEVANKTVGSIDSTWTMPEGKNILIVIDAHSKWIEAICTPSTASSHVIEVLRTLFARFGLPETIVSDNGTGFVSQEFEKFLRKNGVNHTTSAPYHPASNGLAERAVQIVKKSLKKETSGTMSTRLAKVLCSYRITPQSTTGTSPAELLLGRIPIEHD